MHSRITYLRYSINDYAFMVWYDIKPYQALVVIGGIGVLKKHYKRQMNKLAVAIKEFTSYSRWLKY